MPDGRFCLFCRNQPELLHELKIVHEILFLAVFCLFHFYKGYTTHIYLISGGRDSKEIPAVSALEVPVFNNFVTLSKRIYHSEFNV